MADEIEYREIDLSDVSVVEEKRDDGSVERAISGYAAMFEKLSLDFGGWKEKIAPGAFDDSLSRDILLLWSHNLDIVLGRSSNGTLELSVDSTGLKFRGLLDTDMWGDFAFRKIKRKDVKGMSFGFRVLEDTWDINDQKEYIRTLLKVSLIEISPTPMPAYPQTQVQARSHADILLSARRALGEEDKAIAEQVRAAASRRRLLALNEAC